MTVDHKLDYLERVRSQISSVVYPVQYVVDLPVKLGNWISTSLISRKTLLEENARLRAQNLLLKTHSQKFESLTLENQRLRGMIESPVRNGERVLVADLLAVEQESTTHKFVINKGSKQGIYMGQPIVDARGVMGQIVHVGPVSSTGMMITDAEHAVPVEVNRNGVRAIASGEGLSGKMRLDFVPPESDIKEGDLLVSSGLGGHFPKGYPVGKVSVVSANPGGDFMMIEVAPIARLDKAREVLLVWPGISEPDAEDPGQVATR